MPKLLDPLEVQAEPLSLEHFKIGSMEMYQFNCLLLKKRIPQVTSECACGLLKISSNGISGWEECILPSRGKKIDVIQWASVFIKLKGLSVTEAIALVRSKWEVWGTERCSLAESALQDLMKQIHNAGTVKPRIENGIILERSFLIEQSQAYFSF